MKLHSCCALALMALTGGLMASRAMGAPAMPLHLPIQGVARDAADQPIASGNVAVRIYADSLGTTPVYDSGSAFNGTIANGIFDIIVGLATPVSLDPTASWFLELDVAGTEVMGNAAGGRWRFYCGGGDRSRADFEARIVALESAMGLAVAPSTSMTSGNAAQLTSAYSNQHAMLGVSKVSGTASGYTATGNLLLQPVGPHTASGVQAELGPHYLSTSGPNPLIRFVRDVPGDQGRSVRVRWARDLRERAYNAADTQPRITGYTVYRRVEQGQFAAKVPDAPATSALTPQGLAKMTALPPGEWDVLTTVPATLDSAYQTVVPTLCDSNSTAFCRTSFIVRSITDQVGTYHNSVRDSGYSVDNLAPGVPGNFAVTPVSGGAQLAWQASSAPDFQYFRIYRSTDPGFVPGQATLVHATAGSGWTDLTPGSFTYKVTAVDFNGNESVPAVATNTTGLGGETPKFLAFAAMAPNPFRYSLRFVIAVPEASGAVDLSIFDLAGRRVRTLAHQVLAAGSHPFTWDGRTDAGARAGPGMYVARLTGVGRTVTRRASLLP